jgi:hypothetical protein
MTPHVRGRLVKLIIDPGKAGREAQRRAVGAGVRRAVGRARVGGCAVLLLVLVPALGVVQEVEVRFIDAQKG